MAHTHNFHNSKSFMHGLGNKVKQAAEIAGTIKGIWDTGKTIYHAVAPIIGPAVAAAGIL